MTTGPGEFIVFARYLGVRRTTAAMQEYYASAATNVAPRAADTFDAELLRFAGRGSFRAAIADAWARRVRPYGILRARLVLALAILESAPPSFASVNRSVRRSPLRAMLGLALVGVRASLFTALAAILLGPVQLVHAVRDQP